MSNVYSEGRCRTTCWAVAAGIGVLAFLLAMTAGGKSFFAALVLGVIAAVLLGLLFIWLFCGSSRSSSEADGAGATGQAATTAAAATAVGATAAASAAPASAAPAEPEAHSAPAAEASQSAAADGDSGAAAEAPAAPEEAAEPAPAPEPEPVAAPEPAASGDAEPLIKPSTALPGTADLASRKGSWKYEAPKAKPAPKAEAEPAPVADGDYDRDGVVEGTDEGTKPQMLEGPRDGGADNLKEIKGIGPKLEQLCNRLGIYHFDQIAAWTTDEVAWVDANLEGFKGRVSRDEWIDQAKILAAGGETEFSKRVDKGGVY